MSLSRELSKRCSNMCELCSSDGDLDTFIVSPRSGSKTEDTIAVCGNCKSQIDNPESMDPNHWRCLNDSMWSQEPAVQVVSYRILHNLKRTDWAGDLIDMMYLEEDIKTWAKEGIVDTENQIIHKDSNGAILSSGDTVVLTQDLNVKGSSLTAKRGVAVRRIRLDPDNAEYIEGKVDGQHIVILTKYVKKIN